MFLLAVACAMFAMGLLLGFVGAGGSGFMIAILAVGFGVPVHTAMGTALAAMLFSSLSGAVSHYREGNADLRAGLYVGLAGALGAWFGAGVAFAIAPDAIKWFTSGMLALSAAILWLRFALARGKERSERRAWRGARDAAAAVGLGLAAGFLTGAFGIGSTPFFQVGLMLFLGLPVRIAAGSTMLIILPIAASAGVGYYAEGGLDFRLLAAVLAGAMSGAYLGAKFTKRVPPRVLKICMVGTPLAAACLLLL